MLRDLLHVETPYQETTELKFTSGSDILFVRLEDEGHKKELNLEHLEISDKEFTDTICTNL